MRFAITPPKPLQDRASIVGPKVLTKETGAQVINEPSTTRFHIIKGCPCYKEFENEKICINNDNLISISPIMIDPTLFSQILSLEDLNEYKSDRQSMCYLTIALDREENVVYCICKNELIIINQRHVKASDLGSALKFLELTGETMDNAFCSTCIYKYIITMGDVFEDIISTDERERITVGYIKNIAKETLRTIEIEEIDFNDLEAMRALIQRTVQAIAQQVFEYDMLISIHENSLDQRIVNMIDKLKQLCKLNALMMFQIESIIEQADRQVTYRQVQYMTEVAKMIAMISEESESMMAEFQDNEEFLMVMDKIGNTCLKSPIQNEKKYTGLMRVLSKIGLSLVCNK